MAMQYMTVWKDRANPVAIELYRAGVILTTEQMGAITAISIRYLDIYYNSNDHTGIFDWATRAAEGILVIKPGLLPLAIGKDVVELIVYDSFNTEGLFWMQIATRVRGDAALIT